MLMKGSTEDKNHNPFYILLDLSLLIFFIKGCFLCHVLVYKVVLDFKFCLL